MRGTIRYAIAWGPLALSVKNWIIDIRPIDGSVSLHHGSGMRLNGGTDWVVVRKYRIQVLREFTRGQVIYLKSPHNPGGYWVRRLVGLEGDVISIPDCDETETVPQVLCWNSWLNGVEDGCLKGHCWVEPFEDDWVNSCCAVPMALVEGCVSHILWPPSQAGVVQTQLPRGRIVIKGKC